MTDLSFLPAAAMLNAASRLLLICLSCTALLACEQLGVETPAQTAALRDAEGRAIGGACRHAGRALEDCYTINPRATKAAVYNGWRDMDAYMRENKLEIVEPEYEPKNAPSKPERSTAAEKEAPPKLEKPEEAKPEASTEKPKENTGGAKNKPAASSKGKATQT